MAKLILLKFEHGNFQEGFEVLLRISENSGNNLAMLTELAGKFPPSSNLPELYHQWHSDYKALDKFRIYVETAEVGHTQDILKQCVQSAQNFKLAFKNWLLSENRTFQQLLKKIQAEVNSQEIIRIVIQTENTLLRKLPWHEWDLLADTNAEIVLSFIEYKQPLDSILPEISLNRIRKVRVLGILGDSTNINVQEDKKAFWNLRGAYPHFLEQPKRNELMLYLDERWDILFFSGHSESQSDGKSGLLYLNSTEELHISQIKEDLSKAITQGLKIAIFNSCDGLGLARELEDLQIPYIVVWREPVPDLVAHQFVKYFLFEYGNGKSLYASLKIAQQRLLQEKIKSKDGKNYKAEEQFPGVTWLPVICQNILQESISWDELRRKPIEVISQPIDSNRHNLLTKIKRAWIEGLLEKSLYSHVIIDLGLDKKEPSTLGVLTQETSEQPKHTLSPTKKIIDIFDEKGKERRKLLILGEPGTGKTTTLLELARDLIECAEDDPTEPIPVIFNLSSWTEQHSLAEWLIQELHYEPYGVPKTLCRELVENEKLFLLLDGLDEIKPEDQEACVKALNTLSRKQNQTEIVVCSRLADYELLKNRLHFEDIVVIQTLNQEQIEHYLDVTGRAKLSALTTLLPKDTTLQELAKYPATLNFMTYAYQGQTELPKMDSVEERRKDVFEKYVNINLETAQENQKPSQAYTKEKSMHWLTWLAQRTLQESQSVFLIERMQPSLLLTKTQRWMYRLIVLFLSGLIVGLFGSSLLGVMAPNSLEWIINLFFYWFILGFIFLGIFSLIEPDDRSPKLFFKNLKLLWKYDRKNIIKNLLFICFGGILVYLISVDSYYDFNKDGIEKARDDFSKYMGIIFIMWIQFYMIIINSPETFISPKSAVKKARKALFQLRKIEPVETLFFSWKKILNTLKLNVGYWFMATMVNPMLLTIFLISGIILGIAVNLQFGFSIEATGLILGVFILILLGILLSVTLPLGIIFGILELPTKLIGPEIKVEEKTVPNQGILQARKYLIFSSLVVTLGILLITVTYLLDNLVLKIIFIIIEIGLVIFWLSFGLWTAGRTLIQHISLRSVLYFSGYIPHNYGHFLDHASEHFFLRKVGGGYSFIHRILQEYFAQREPVQVATWEKKTITRNKKQASFLNTIKAEIEEQLRILPNGISLNITKKVTIGSQPRTQLSNDTNIIDIVDWETEGKLLILGAPESGKTITLLELAQEFVNRAENNPSQPIPVLLNLSSWKGKKQTFAQWIWTELNLNYGIEENLGKDWIYEQQLILLLDGLHELNFENSEHCVQVINQFLESEYKPKSLVVCNRLAEHEMSYAKPNLIGTIYLQPLTETQINQYLKAVQRIDLLQIIQKDSSLLELAKSPLLLNMIVQADQLSIQTWQQSNTQEAHRQYMLNAYIKSMLDKKIEQPWYKLRKEPKPEKAQHWLACLATNMKQDNQGYFLIDTIQPTWLQNGFQKAIYRFISGLGLGLVFGLIFGLINGLGAGLVSAFSEELWLAPMVGLLAGLGNGLEVGLIAAPIIGLIAIINRWWLVGLITGTGLLFIEELKEIAMAFGFWEILYKLFELELFIIENPIGNKLIIVLITGLITGLVSWLLKKIRLTTLLSAQRKVQNRLIWGGIVGTGIGGLIWYNGNQLTSEVFGFGLWYGMVGGLIFGLIPFAAFIQHFALHVTFRWFGFIPKSYAQFLNCATKRLLMRKVGKQFRFIHDSLREHLTYK